MQSDEEGYAGCVAFKGYDSGTEADRGDGVDSAGGGRTSGRGHTGNHSGRRGMCTCGYFSWVDRLSLGGVRVLLTRPRELSGTTAQKLRKCGAEVIELPAIRTKARENNTALQQALTNISDYAWIVFTSPTGVRVFFEELQRQRFDVRRFSGVKFAVIGTGTAKELEKHGFYADLMPEVFDAAHLGAALAKVCSHARVLIPRAAIGSPELLAELQKTEGVQADDIAIYDTVYGLEEDPEASPVQIKRELEQARRRMCCLQARRP